MAQNPQPPGRIWEYRICMPMTVEEYHVAQLWSVAEASKNETGGGEGLEVQINEPFESKGAHAPETPLIATGKEFTTGQYTKKVYYLSSKVPTFVRAIAPKGSLTVYEKAWNAYPYCRTVISNEYMKGDFYISIESFHAPDRGEQDNVHGLSEEDLKRREVHHIDIADNNSVQRGDYKEEWDPTRYHSEKSDRGPLPQSSGTCQQQQVKQPNGSVIVGQQGEWSKTHEPVMCCYKLVRVLFKWWGLQGKIEKFILKQERRIFNNFHRQVFCWTDKWYGMTMEDIRKIEEETKRELDKQRASGTIRGTKASDE